MAKLTRRAFLKIAITAAVVVAAASIGFKYLPTIITPPRRELRIYNYSYYIDPSILDEFRKEYKCEIIYDEFEEAEEAWAKLQIGGGGYDIIVLTDSYVPEAIKRGLVRKIDHSKIPNLKNIDPVFFENPYTPGLEYGIPYAWGTTGIGVNYMYLWKALPEYEGKFFVDSWKYLFDEEWLKKYPRKVSMLSEFIEVMFAAKLYLGIPFDDWSEESMKKVIELLKKQKPYLAGYFGASKYVPALVTGEVYLCQAWSGDVLWARDEFVKELKKRGQPEELAKLIQYVIPKEGALRWIDFMVIPRDARNIELAYEFINFLLNPNIAARNVNYTWYPSPVKYELVEPYLDEEVKKEPAVYPPPELAKKLYFTPYSPEAIEWAKRIRLELYG